jgi:hypothetical protein
LSLAQIFLFRPTSSSFDSDDRDSFLFARVAFDAFFGDFLDDFFGASSFSSSSSEEDDELEDESDDEDIGISSGLCGSMVAASSANSGKWILSSFNLKSTGS